MNRLKKNFTNSIYIVFLMFICLSFFGCSILLLTDETAHVPFEHTDALALVIEKGLYPSLEQTLDWYNNYGYTDDQWFLGMVILGDPMLVVSKKTVKGFMEKPMTALPPTAEEIEKLTEKLTQFAEYYEESNFAEYKSKNSGFFSG